MRQIRPNLEEILCSQYEAEAKAQFYCHGLAQVRGQLSDLERLVERMEKQMEKSERIKRRAIQLLED